MKLKHTIAALSLGLILASCQSKSEDKEYGASGLAVQTLPELAEQLKSGEISAQELVETYWDRIAKIDRAGPQLQAVLTLNPDVFARAQALDAKRESGAELGSLFGIPVLLKDNIEAKGDMATTAGALALKDNVTRRNSPLVEGLLAADAIILGKANLSQWANFRSSHSLSGWSALGGQVKNPHILNRNPCGSSSGSGTAIAASLTAGAVGTETNGSIICPSQVGGIVGFKPTVGLVSQRYIVPISSTQDTAGPMTKTVTGAAMMLGPMAGGKTDYAAMLDAESLQGTRIGVLNYAKGSNPDIHNKFKQAQAALEKAGAVLVSIDGFKPGTDNFSGKSYDVLKYEFKATLNAYLAEAAPNVKTRSLADIIAFNTENPEREMALFGQDILEASQAMGPLSDAAYVTAKEDVHTAVRQNGIDRLMSENNVAVLISPSGPVAGQVDPVNGDVWPSWAGAGGLAARAGYPHLTVPMGTIHGMPVGLSFIAGADQDAAVLSYGYAYEQQTQLRPEPQYLATAHDRPEIKRALVRPQ